MSKRNQHKDVQRFTADEIVRAIDAVTKAGLTVCSVEITNSGSIKIETQPSQQHSSKAKTSPVNARYIALPSIITWDAGTPASRRSWAMKSSGQRLPSSPGASEGAGQHRGEERPALSELYARPAMDFLR